MRFSKAGALGIGGTRAMARVWAGRNHLAIHCSVFLGCSFHDGNICEWKRLKALGVGAILLDFHIFGRDIKAQKSTSVSLVVEAVYSTKFKKKKKHHPICMPSH